MPQERRPPTFNEFTHNRRQVTVRGLGVKCKLNVPIDQGKYAEMRSFFLYRRASYPGFGKYSVPTGRRNTRTLLLGSRRMAVLVGILVQV